MTTNEVEKNGDAASMIRGAIDKEISTAFTSLKDSDVDFVATMFNIYKDIPGWPDGPPYVNDMKALIVIANKLMLENQVLKSKLKDLSANIIERSQELARITVGFQNQVPNFRR